MFRVPDKVLKICFPLNVATCCEPLLDSFLQIPLNIWFWELFIDFYSSIKEEHIIQQCMGDMRMVLAFSKSIWHSLAASHDSVGVCVKLLCSGVKFYAPITVRKECN
jgi:hypothetical protein